MVRRANLTDTGWQRAPPACHSVVGILRREWAVWKVHAARNGPGRVSAAAISAMFGGWLFGAVARRVSTRTGVSDAEAYGSLPGDDLIAHPMVEWTRGITVARHLPSGCGHGWFRWATPRRLVYAAVG